MRSSIFLASTCSLFLAGCGGGGSDDVPISTTDSIFSDPVPTQCEIKYEERICSAPTSSFSTAALIPSYLTDPSMGKLGLKGLGYSYFQYNRWDFNGTEPIPTAGQVEYDSSEEDLVISANSISFRNKIYTFAKTYADGSIRSYCAANNDCFYTNPSVYLEWQPESGPGNLLDIHLTDTSKSTGSFLSTEELRATEWDAYAGLLSDRLDVLVPTDERIHYSGIVFAAGGDGKPLGRGFNEGFMSCPIELTLNTRNGDITTDGASCSGNGASLSLSLKPLVLKKSKVQPILLGDSAILGAMKTDGFSFNFQSTKISGAVYGRNANTLVIFGSGPLGVFQIVGNRLR
jgi:hypothetical protein